jgi:gamma-glutamylcyclotransferase (GGCT)/AIG2-like uncharacterized protein YtfP
MRERPLSRITEHPLAKHVFFYGTLMSPFNRPGRQRVDPHLTYMGRGTINASLFDLGIYPAAVPAVDGSVVWGELYEMAEQAGVLAVLDEIEGYRPDEPDRSLYARTLTQVMLESGDACQAWVYLYNAPLGQAQRIVSGDYLEHVKGDREPDQ